MSEEAKQISHTTTEYDDGCLRRVVEVPGVGFAGFGWQTYYVTNETATMSKTTNCPIHSQNITEAELSELRRKHNA